jgi:predicted amidophosphoribosyltransferase
LANLKKWWNLVSTTEPNARLCPLCAKPLPKNRGVCPECGGKIRMLLGCISIFLFALAMFGMFAVGVWLT